MTPSSDRQAPLRILIGTLVLFALWEYVGHTTEWGRFILPPPDRILAQFWTDRELYWLHGLSTLRSAGLGFLIGTAAALLAAFVFCLSPALELALRGLNIAIFAMPAIVIGPLLVIFFQGNWPQIILAALMVYFPAMSAMLLTGSTFTLAKMLRDRHEAQRLHQRIEEAKTEQLLKTYELKPPLAA